MMEVQLKLSVHTDVGGHGWYARVLATHRFNLPESGSILPWRVSYLNSGYIAESELVTEAGLMEVLVEVFCHTARRHSVLAKRRYLT